MANTGQCRLCVAKTLIKTWQRRILTAWSDCAQFQSAWRPCVRGANRQNCLKTCSY